MKHQPKAKGTGKAHVKTRKVRVTFTATVDTDVSIKEVAAAYEGALEWHGPGWKRTRVKAEDVGSR